MADYRKRTETFLTFPRRRARFLSGIGAWVRNERCTEFPVSEGRKEKEMGPTRGILSTDSSLLESQSRDPFLARNAETFFWGYRRVFVVQWNDHARWSLLLAEILHEFWSKSNLANSQKRRSYCASFVVLPRLMWHVYKVGIHERSVRAQGSMPCIEFLISNFWLPIISRRNTLNSVLCALARNYFIFVSKFKIIYLH